MRALMTLLTASLVLSGCAKQLPELGLAAAPYCDVARPIYWSAADTRATKAQADRENVKWKRLCVTRERPARP